MEKFLQYYLFSGLSFDYDRRIFREFVYFDSFYACVRQDSFNSFSGNHTFILLFIPSFLSGISVLSKVLGLLPDQLLQISEAVNYFNLYQMGGKVVGAIPIIMILYFVLYCVLLPALYQMYRKAEIK